MTAFSLLSVFAQSAIEVRLLGKAGAPDRSPEFAATGRRPVDGVSMISGSVWGSGESWKVVSADVQCQIALLVVLCWDRLLRTHIFVGDLEGASSLVTFP